MTSASSAPVQKSSTDSLGFIVLDDYDQNNSETKAIKLSFETIKQCFQTAYSDKLSIKVFNQAVKALENNKNVETTELHKLLLAPPTHILNDRPKNAIYQRLFVRCLSLETENSVIFFKKLLSSPNSPVNITDELVVAHGKLCENAIPCFSLLPANIQQEFKNVLTLLENQPESTFTDTTKFQVYKVAAYVFTNLNTTPAADLEDYNFTDEILKVTTVDPASVKKTEDEQPPEEPIKTEAITISPNLTDSIICPKELLQVIVRHSPPGAEQKGLNSRLEQFKSISKFGKSLLIDYGPQILERASGALVEALKIKKNRDLFIDLLIGILIPGLSSSAENPFTQKVVNVGRSALQKRMPDLINDVVGYTTKTLRDPKDGPEFVALAMEYLTPLCFQATTASPTFKKQLLVTLLSSVKDFMKDLNSSLEELAKTQKEALSPQDEELKLIHLMNSRIKAKKLPIIVPDHMNTAMMKENVLNVTQTLLKTFMSPTPDNPASFSPKQQLLLFVLSLYLHKIVDRIFSPDTLCVLIDRILENPLSLSSTVNPPTPPLDGRLDEKYTAKLSTLFHELAIEVIKMGGTPSYLQSLIDLLEPLIKSKLNKAASEAHKSLEEVMSTPFLSDTVITPVLILDQILYNKTKPTKEGEKVQRLPVLNMMQFLSDSPPDVEVIRKRVNADIKKKPYANIKSLIDANVSTPVRIGLKALPIESFCQNLTDRVYKLSQQEMLMKMLFGYLSHGITQMIKTPIPAKK